ncbi:hypothetical protein [Flavobacterium sp. J27]|uniref:hypothetical protein n=1 Tax=Flavobacterium sp. J27 TaxID=2060419 RepID=UPI00102F6FA9|nr:hypothetical protein [Flavobacterium sp. J27]
MLNYQPELSNLLFLLEIIASLIALVYYKTIKETYWKWFTFYLFIIFLCDVCIVKLVPSLGIKKQFFHAYIVIPLQFIFFYWLYAYQSLKKKSIFWLFLLLYVLSFIPIELYFARLKVVYSFNYTVGSFLLMILVFLEFQKQIKNDAILKFKQNKMFYINMGIMLFYVGTLPFFGLYNLIVKEPEIWNMYYLYFLLSNCLMYLLFTASFIWGKAKL